MSVPITSGASGSAGVLPQAVPAAAGGQAVQAPVPQVAAPKPTQQQLESAMKQLQDQVRSSAQNLQFSLDNETGKTVVRVTDAESGEVIRQIPSEELIAIAKSIDKMQGLLLRQEA